MFYIINVVQIYWLQHWPRPIGPKFLRIIAFMCRPC